MIIERSVSIARPANEVYDYVLDMRNDLKWHTDALDVRQETEGPVGEGTVFWIKFKPMMGVSEGTSTVTQLEPAKRIVLKGEMGKFRPTVTYTFEPAGTGTRVTRRVEMRPPGIMGLMASLMKGMFGKRNDGFLANLKRELESS